MEATISGALGGAAVGLFLMIGVYVVFDAGIGFKIWWKENSAGFVKTVVITAIIGAILVHFGGG